MIEALLWLWLVVASAGVAGGATAQAIPTRGSLGTDDVACFVKNSAAGVVHALESAHGEERCGVSAVFDSNGTVDYLHRGEKLPCGTPMTTNCSYTYQGITCPEECAYLVPNKRFVCVFECVSAPDCVHSNNDLVFADPDIRMCRLCEVFGCKECDTLSTCKLGKCHEHFTLDASRTRCEFDLDVSFTSGWFCRSLVCLLWILASVILVAVVKLMLFGATGPSLAKMNRGARSFRNLCRVAEWQLGAKFVRRPFSLTADLTKSDVAGAGMPLFYNWLFFILFVTTILAFTKTALYEYMGLDGAYAAAGESGMWMGRRDLHSSRTALPATVTSPLLQCGEESTGIVLNQLKDFAELNFYVMGFLYIALFLLSLLHTWRQQRIAIKYDARNKTMSDFAVKVSGLNPDLTDEGEITEALNRIFSQAVEEEEGHSDVEVVGVSLCYDTRDVAPQVKRMKSNLFERMDADMRVRCREDCDIPHLPGLSSDCDKSAMQDLAEKDREMVRAWFDPDFVPRDVPQESRQAMKLLRTTGDLFAVLRRSDHKARVRKVRPRIEQLLSEDKLLVAEDASATLSEVFSEPPCINWLSLWTSRRERQMQLFWASSRWLLMVVLGQVLVTLPYTYLVVLPYSHVGSAAKPPVQKTMLGDIFHVEAWVRQVIAHLHTFDGKKQIAGILIGLTHTFIGTRVRAEVKRLGFHGKTAGDQVLFIADASLMFANWLAGVAIVAFMAMHRGSDAEFTIWRMLRFETFSAVAAESSLTESVYYTLMPGSLFIIHISRFLGSIGGFLRANILVTVYGLGLIPPCLSRATSFISDHADSLFQPQVMSLPSDYAIAIVKVGICWQLLCFVSPYTWKLWMCLCASFMFQILSCRYTHLRLCKASFFTTSRLDSCVNFAWGVPLSVVAVAWAVWGVRAEILYVPDSFVAFGAVVLFAFCCSFAAWCLTYHRLLKPFALVDAVEDKHSTVDNAMKSTLCSWFNCNPVYVLKCEYYNTILKRTPCAVMVGEGAVRVKIRGTEGLRLKDDKKYYQQVFVRVRVIGKPNVVFDTPAIEASENPVWDHIFDVFHISDGDELCFELRGVSSTMDDTLLGRATMRPDTRNGHTGFVDFVRGQGMLDKTDQGRLSVEVYPVKGSAEEYFEHQYSVTVHSMKLHAPPTSTSSLRKTRSLMNKWMSSMGLTHSHSTDSPDEWPHEEERSPATPGTASEQPSEPLRTNTFSKMCDAIMSALVEEDGGFMSYWCEVGVESEARGDIVTPQRRAFETGARHSKHTTELEVVWDFRSGMPQMKTDELCIRLMRRKKGMFGAGEELGRAPLAADKVLEAQPLELGNASVVVSFTPARRPLPTTKRPSHHPVACGEDQFQVRWYEVGKQYLFVVPARQSIIASELEGSPLEEAYLLLVGHVAKLLEPMRCFPLFPKRATGRAHHIADWDESDYAALTPEVAQGHDRTTGLAAWFEDIASA